MKTKKTSIAVDLEFHDKINLRLHTQLVHGEYEGHEFRLIQCASNSCFELQYKGKTLNLQTRDLVTAMMDKMLEMQPKKGK